jgi:vacuolar-type H+-ATPase subunit F/Vma7
VSCALRVLCRPEVGAGFRLAGIPVVESSTATAAIEQFRELLGTSNLGVVLMEESFHEQIPEDLRRRLGRMPLPMVVPFPDPVWAERPETAESYIVELLRQVIGYRVRLR